MDATNPQSHLANTAPMGGSRSIPLPRRLTAIRERLAQLYDSGHYLGAIMISYGKDSSLVGALAITAWRLACESNTTLRRWPLLFCSADTGIETPKKAQHIRQQQALIQAYANRHNLIVEFVVARPTLASSWQGSVVAGRRDNINVTRGQGGRCTQDWKLSPLIKALRSRVKHLVAEGVIPGELRPLQLVGSRYQESGGSDNNARSRKMKRREAQTIRLGDGVQHDSKERTWKLFPIAELSTEDVWHALMFAETEPGSPFEAPDDGYPSLLRFYNDLSGGGECGITAASGSCASARDGCHQCMVITKDRSVTNLASEYPNLYGLSLLRTWQVGHDHDFARRNHLLAIQGDHLQIKPAGYAGAHLQTLLALCLALDYVEQVRASVRYDAYVDHHGHIPDRLAQPECFAEFELITAQQLVYINLMWMTRALCHTPNAAFKQYLRIGQDHRLTAMGKTLAQLEVGTASREQKLAQAQALFTLLFAHIESQVRADNDQWLRDQGVGALATEPTTTPEPTRVIPLPNRINGAGLRSAISEQMDWMEERDAVTDLPFVTPSQRKSRSWGNRVPVGDAVIAMEADWSEAYQVDPARAGAFIGVEIGDWVNDQDRDHGHLPLSQRCRHAIDSLLYRQLVTLSKGQRSVLDQRLQVMSWMYDSGLACDAIRGGVPQHSLAGASVIPLTVIAPPGVQPLARSVPNATVAASSQPEDTAMLKANLSALAGSKQGEFSLRLPLAAVASLLPPVDPNKPIEERLQRKLIPAHADGIEQYLLANPDDWYLGSLVVLYDPKALTVTGRGPVLEVELRRSEDHLVVDGQHRRQGIAQALTANPSLDGDIDVQIVPFTTPEKALEIFQLLNGRARKPSSSTLLFTNHLDPLPNFLRELLGARPLLRKRIAVENGAKRDTYWDLATIKKVIMLATGRTEKSLDKLLMDPEQRPKIALLANHYLDALQWLPGWDAALEGSLPAPEQYLHTTSALLQLVAIWFRQLCLSFADSGVVDWGTLQQLGATPMARSDMLWRGSIVNTLNGRMDPKVEPVRAAAAALCVRTGVPMSEEMQALHAKYSAQLPQIDLFADEDEAA